MTTNREQDVLDAIDALVDEQMAGGEPIGGYDYGDPDYPSCPHCSRGWHGLAITQRIERMRWTGEMDEDYRYAEDDSPVLCPGSEFIGPVATPDQLHWMRQDDETKKLFPDGHIPTANELISATWHLGFHLESPYFMLPGPSRSVLQEALRGALRRDHSAWSIQVGDDTERNDQAPRPDIARGELRTRLADAYFLERARVRQGGRAAGQQSRAAYEWSTSINDGDRVAFVDRNGVRYEGIAHVENTVVDEERPWISRTAINLEQVTTVPSEVRGVTVGPEIYDEAIDPMHSARNRIAEFQNQLAAIAADAELTFDSRMWLPGDRVPAPAAETPQQRALPRPSTTPPMWANDPARTRRNRNRSRNIRTPRV